MGLLSILLLLPLMTAGASWLLPRGAHTLLKWLHLGMSLVQLMLVLGWVLPSVSSLPSPEPTSALPTVIALEEALPWLHLELGSLGTLQVDYRLGVDGLSVLMVLLQSLLMPVAIGASWQVSKSPKAYFALLQLLNTAVMGSFLALDLILFYLFFEVMLLPMFFLIGIWGGERRTYAAIKFFLFTLLGSVLMLVVVLGLPFSRGGEFLHSTAFAVLSDTSRDVSGGFYNTPWGMQVGFVLLLVAFAIKLPAVPLHTWLPDAHVEASTPISVLLAGILLKAGGYGILRVAYGLFPSGGQALSYWVVLLGVVGIVYASLVALAQKDLKRLVAYSSVAHMGYVLLGAGSFTATGWNGAILQLFAHGLVTAMLFLAVGVLYDRVHSRQIADFGGLWQQMPRFTILVVIAFFAGLGLPGTAPFVAEILSLMGGFEASEAGRISYWLAGISLLGIILAAGYFLWTFQRMFLGPLYLAGGDAWKPRLVDLSLREQLLLWPLAVLVLVAGIWPQIVADFTGGWVAAFFQWLTKVPQG